MLVTTLICLGTFVAGFALAKATKREPKKELPINLIDGVTLPNPSDPGWKVIHKTMIWRTNDGKEHPKEFRFLELGKYRVCELGAEGPTYFSSGGYSYYLGTPYRVRFEDKGIVASDPDRKYSESERYKRYQEAVWHEYMNRSSLEAEEQSTRALLEDH